MAQLLPPSRLNITPPQSPSLSTFQSVPCSEEVEPPQPAKTRLASKRAAESAEMEEQRTGCPSVTGSHEGRAAPMSAVRHTPPLTVAASHAPPEVATAACIAPADVMLLFTFVAGPSLRYPAGPLCFHDAACGVYDWPSAAQGSGGSALAAAAVVPRSRTRFIARGRAKEGHARDPQVVTSVPIFWLVGPELLPDAPAWIV